jgi:predicted enzyme involved in methoxymalonyl-ACP biosynthesis
MSEELDVLIDELNRLKRIAQNETSPEISRRIQELEELLKSLKG